MHIAEAGQGLLVVMCHGRPESWYSWRHRLVALAKAGFHAVAPTRVSGGESIPMTMSVGVAAFRPGSETGVEELLSAADRALCAAKAIGRNAVQAAA